MTDALRPKVAMQLGEALQRMQRGAERHESASLARRAALRLAEQGRFGSSPRADAQLLALINFGRGSEPPPLTPSLERLLDDAMLVAHIVATTKVAVQSPYDQYASLGRDLRAATWQHDTAVQRVMRSILGADREDLPGLLRSAASLLESANQPLAAHALISQLGAWEADRQWVQKRWAYDLWAGRSAHDDDQTTPEEEKPS